MTDFDRLKEKAVRYNFLFPRRKGTSRDNQLVTKVRRPYVHERAISPNLPPCGTAETQCYPYFGGYIMVLISACFAPSIRIKVRVRVKQVSHTPSQLRRVRQIDLHR